MCSKDETYRIALVSDSKVYFKHLVKREENQTAFSRRVNCAKAVCLLKEMPPGRSFFSLLLMLLKFPSIVTHKEKLPC